jgi:hypothetical protein
MKALNKTLAAATLAVAASFSGAASAQDNDCAMNWVAPAEVAKTLFSSPVSDWNLPVIESLGAQTLSVLSKQGVNLINRDAREVERVFTQIARRQAKGQDIDWQGVIESAHPATRAAYEAAANGASTDQAKQMALEGLSAYQAEAVSALGNLNPAPNLCLVVKGGVAPALPKQ